MTPRERAALDHWKNNPVEAVKDWFGVTPDDYQADILNSVFVGGKDRVAVKSAHGPGKSAVLSFAGWIFLNCFDLARVVATAPTFPQLHDVLWPEYAKWHAFMPDSLANKWEISGNHIRRKGKLGKTWFAVSRTSNKPENLQGFHNTNLMVQGDEGSAIPADVFEVLEGALSEAGEAGGTAKLMLMGNPNFTAGEFYTAFGKNKELYDRLTLTGDPKLLEELGIEQGAYHKDHGRVYFAPRVKQRYREVMARKYGEKSAVYDVRVRGVFPRADDKAVIPLEWAEAAALVPLPTFDAIADTVTIVVDVARFGGDETTLGGYRGGHNIYLRAHVNTSTVQTANLVLDLIKAYRDAGLIVGKVVVDEPGIGGGVIDDLAHFGCPVPVVPYNGGRAMNAAIDPEDDCRMFANVRSRDWWYARRIFEARKTSIVNDETLVNQLASIQYAYNERERIQVESKRKLKDRLGEDASPDRADNIVMGLAPWYSTAEVNTDLSADEIITLNRPDTDDLGLNDFDRNPIVG